MLHVPFRGRANLRNHRKMVLADGRAAIIGGMNLAGEYMGPEGTPKRWCDLSLVLEGPVVGDLNEVFASDWAFAAGEEGSEARPTAPAETPGPAPVQLVPSGPDVPGDFLYDTILTRFFGAVGRIWVVTPYFVPDDALTRALCIAARRGVDVRIVVPAVSNHRFADMARRGYLRQVQTAGGAVYRFIPGMLHAKVILIDDSVSVVGSMNMDLRSLFLNYEVACFVESADVARRLGEWAEGVMARSEVGLRPAAAPVEFIEGIGRLFAPLL
jgi:cardiolipin synthase